jgi:hypothetical protein
MNLHYVRKIWCVNLSYFVLVVLEKKNFQWPHPIFAFILLSPLEENLALHVDSFLLSSPKDDLYQVWLKLASWFWRKRFFNINMVFPIVATPEPCRKLPSKYELFWPSSSWEDF